MCIRDRNQGDVGRPLQQSVRTAARSGLDALHRRARADEHFGNVKTVNVHLEVVLGICNGALEELDERLGGRLAGIH